MKRHTQSSYPATPTLACGRTNTSTLGSCLLACSWVPVAARSVGRQREGSRCSCDTAAIYHANRRLCAVEDTSLPLLRVRVPFAFGTPDWSRVAYATFSISLSPLSKVWRRRECLPDLTNNNPRRLTGSLLTLSYDTQVSVRSIIIKNYRWQGW